MLRNQPMKVQGKVALVTGAGSGMGRELTLELVRRGAKVAALDLRPESLEETKKLAGGNNHVATFAMDVTNGDKVAKLPDAIKQEIGEVDILINNAGIIQPFVEVNDLKMDVIHRVMDVNFYGPLTMIKTFLPELLRRPQAHILNVSSMGAYAPVPGQSVYGASKAALKLLTEGLRSELLGTNVGVTIAFPGAVVTNITSNSGLSIPSSSSKQNEIKQLPASEAAKIMIDAIENGSPRVTVGQDATFLDLLSRLHPVYTSSNFLSIYNMYKKVKTYFQ